MIWLLALLAPLGFAVNNVIDKHLVSREFDGKSIFTLSSLAGLIGLPITVVLFLLVIFDQQSLTALQAVAAFTAGFILNSSFILYYFALVRSAATNTALYFAFIPVFSFLFDVVVFHEQLEVPKLIGSFLVVSGAVAFGYIHSKDDSLTAELKAGLYMVLCSLLVACSYAIFKGQIGEEKFLVGFFFEYLASVTLGLLLLLIPIVRKELVEIKEKAAIRQLAINGSNEIVSLIAMGSQRWVSLAMPLFLTTALTRLQIVFVFLLELVWLSKVGDVKGLRKLRRGGFRKLVAGVTVLGGVFLVVYS